MQVTASGPKIHIARVGRKLRRRTFAIQFLNAAIEKGSDEA